MAQERDLPVGPEEGGFGMSYVLLYGWHGTPYWGAAHGLAGILHVLLHFPLSGDDMEDVKSILRYMMRNRFPHSGNYHVSEGNPRDKLVQWSHGAGGIALTLCQASEVSSWS